ncbi:MAG: energy transducer TonB [Gammaproteobacteria bacterium]|nr:energy transducer TonB [Gammaproteobacteria bacterium]
MTALAGHPRFDPRITLGLALSLALHGLLLTLGSGAAPERGGPAVSRLAVRLTDPSPAAPRRAEANDEPADDGNASEKPPPGAAGDRARASHANAEPVRAAPQRRHPEPQPEPAVERATDDVPASPPPAASRPGAESRSRPRPAPAATESRSPATKQRPARAQASEPGDAAVDRDALVERVRLALGRHFDYPLLARRRGWQGTVVLGFEMSAQGRIEHARVLESSGHRLLDRTALDALRHIDGIRGARTLLRGRTVELELPVVYRLTRG